MAYNGSVELISGIKQKNGGNFPLVDASAVRVDDSTRLPAALAGKVNTEDGKGLSTNDYTDADKAALDNIKTTDPDLETAGKAADAKAVGEEFAEIIDEITKIADKLPTDHIAGSFITTDSLPYEQKLKIRAQITALQAGSGTPSGENIRAISGWDYADLRVTGVNVWGGDDMISDIKSAISDAVVNQANHTVSFVWNNTASKALFTGFKPSARYTVILTFSNNSNARTNMQVNYSDGTHESIPATVSGSKETTVFVTKANRTIVSISKTGSGGTTTVYAAESGVFEGVKTANDFVAYAGKSYVTDFSSTLYGGVVDYTEGTITVTKGYIASYNGESLPGAWISDRDAYSIGAVPTTGAQVVYDLAEPTVVDITPVDILSVQGINNIWVDCGNVEYYYAISIPAALADKVDKADGKGLSENDFTDADKAALDNIKTTDPDLETAGKAADAKAVGQAVSRLKDAFVTKSAEGKYIIAADAAQNIETKEYSTTIEAVQSGSGDPSGSNIRPITGWDAVTVYSTGSNIWGGDQLLADVHTAISAATVDETARTVTFSENDTAARPLFANFEPNTRYTFVITYSGTKPRANMQVNYTDGSTDAIPIASEANTKETVVFSSDAGKTIASLTKIKSSGSTTVYADESGIYKGAGSTDRSPYTGHVYTIALPSTVFGGDLDVTNGILKITHGQIESYAGETLPGAWISDRDVYVVGATPTTGAQVVYELAEPTTASVEFYSVRTASAPWHINSDTGVSNVVYPQSMEQFNNTVYRTGYNIAQDFWSYNPIDASGQETISKRFIHTDDYIDGLFFGFRVAPGYKVSVIKYAGSAVSRDYWIRSTTTANYDLNYVFDHANYKYRLYVGDSSENIITDLETYAKAVTFYIRGEDVGEKLSEADVEFSVMDTALEATNDVLYGFMRANYDLKYANANRPLGLNSPYGNTQNVHPKVLYFSNKLFGHYFWMAYTPYAFSETEFENPCIAYSDDGYHWENAVDVPLDVPSVGYNSDTHLVYNPVAQRLECWYRHYVSTPSEKETIYRMTSLDGFTWGNKEQLYESSSADHVLSPAIIYDEANSIYKIWVVSAANGYHIEYFESATGASWTRDTTTYPDIFLSYTYGGRTYNVWHIDVNVISGSYVILAKCKSGTDHWDLFLTSSSDNINYSTPEICMIGATGKWDTKLYRSCLCVVGSEYRIYYSGLKGSVYGIGVSSSPTLDQFVGRLKY